MSCFFLLVHLDLRHCDVSRHGLIADAAVFRQENL